MKLLKPLVLADATTTDVSLVPTKKFFKMVLVIEAPCTAEQADILGMGWLFDQGANPREFGGNVKAVGEEANAEITLTGKATAGVTILTERVAHISMARIEKTGMILAARIHLPEVKPKKLVELLEFLSTMNKTPFELIVTPAQRSMDFGGAPASSEFGKDENGLPLPNAQGMYDVMAASVRNFTDDKFVVAAIATIEIEGGFIGGWNCRINGKLPMNEGEALHRDREVFGAESEALQAAVKGALGLVSKFLKEADDVPSLAKPRAGVLEFKSFLIGLSGWPEGAPQ